MKTKKNHEGYLLIDHSGSPGVSDETLVTAGLPIGLGRGRVEMATFTCSHCHAVIIVNPLRTRERAYCSGCDHYICDGCGAVRAVTLECKTLESVIEAIQESGV
jgi:hypothetical protein